MKQSQWQSQTSEIEPIEICHCFECIFWNGTERTGRGECRLNPPVYRDGFYGKWPETLKLEWCGKSKMSYRNEREEYMHGPKKH